MQIKDLNVYLFGKSSTFKLHIYTQSPLLQFECPVGEYNLYIAANLHADMADLSPAELEAYTVAAQTAYDDLPMSAKTTLTIAASAQGKVVTLPTIQVRRCVAKIAYNIRVDNTVSDIELQSVRLMNIPRTSPLFTSARASENKADYTSGFYSEIPASGSAAFSGVCYVFENMQDPNTPWKNKREVVIKLKFTQNEDRDDATCEISVEKKLAQPKPVETKFALGTNLTTGEVLAEEYGPGIKGQISLDEYQKEQHIDGKTVDVDTGEIIEESEENDGVVDFRQVKQA